MQDANTSNGGDSLQSSGDFPLASHEPGGPPDLESAALPPPTETLKDKPLVAKTPVSFPSSGPDVQHQTFLPPRGFYYTVLARIIAGVLAALLTVVITSVNAGTFHAASQQIVVDRLTVKTALTLAAWELLTFLLSLLIGFCLGLIVGKIAVRRRLGFLAGALAGAVFSLIIFFVSLIPTYPGNLAVNGTPVTPGSLLISFLLLCLWSMGGGLVSLFGTWITTVRHPHYLSHGT